MQPLSQVSEREDRESSTREYGLSKCQESLSNPRLGVFILPLPVTSRYGQNAYLADCPRCPRGLSTLPSRTLHVALADCPRLNSKGKNAKSTAGRRGCWAGWTVRQDPTNRLPGPRGLFAGRLRTVRPVHRATHRSV
jgi:hypothetical protein